MTIHACYGSPTRTRVAMSLLFASLLSGCAHFRNRRVEPSNDYTYDAIYRLITATGREHLGQNQSGALLPPSPSSYNDARKLGPRPPTKKPRHSFEPGVFCLLNWPGGNLLSRTRLHTIIGANPFHGPVRDGKAWFQAAMAAR